MHSFLITGGTPDKRREKTLAFAEKNQVSTFDTLVVDPDEGENKTIGIDEIRNLKTKLALKPFNSKIKLAVLLNFEKATPEAQNAFLKTLEEPPNNTLIVLTAPNTDLLLPTLVSRCQVIQLQTTNYQLLTDKESEVISGQLPVVFNGKVGERLKLAQDIGKNRKEALAWLEKMIIASWQMLLSNPAPHGVSIVRKLQETHTTISTTNVNPRFALEICFLGL